MTSADIETEIEDESNYQKYLKDVLEYEKRQNEDDQSPLKKRKKNPTDVETTISTEDYGKISFAKNLGIFWPEDLMKLHKVDYQDEELQWVEPEAGFKLKGIYRDPFYGEPPGTFKVVKETGIAAKKNSDLHNSFNAISEGETTALWTSLQKKMKVVSAAEKGTKQEDGSFKITSNQVHYTHRIKRDAEADLADFMWPNAAVEVEKSSPKSGKGGSRGQGARGQGGKGQGGRGQGGRGQGGKGRQKGQGERDKELKGSGRRSNGTKGGGKAGAPANKRVSAMQLTEQIMLQCEQVQQNVQNSDMIMSITTAKIESCIKKLAERIAPGLVDIYTGELDDQGKKKPCTDGWNLLERAKNLRSWLQQVQDLVVSLQAKPSEEKFLPSSLHSAYQKARNGQIGLPLPEACILQRILERDITPKIIEGRYCEVAVALNPLTNPDEGVFCLMDLPFESRSDFQKDTILEHMSDLCREPGQRDKVIQYMIELKSVQILDRQLEAENKRLDVMLNPMSRKYDIDSLSENRRLFENDKSMLYHKAIAFFPTGQDILAEVDRAILQRSSDHGFKADLIGIVANIRPLAGNTDNPNPNLIGPKQVLGNDFTVWKQSFEQYAQIHSNASDEFRMENAEDLGFVQGVFDKIKQDLAFRADCLFVRFASTWMVSCAALFDDSFALEKKDTLARLATVKKELDDAISEGIIDPMEAGVTVFSLHDDLMRKTFMSVHGYRENFLNTYQNCYSGLTLGTIALDSDCCAIFGEIIMNATADKFGLSPDDADLTEKFR